eukprot:TRINITY_DN3352_c0_g1_i3.p1 TRINITY_DN3352_c0_g1~~TRINITY_DN3352_c0_g1_i3.p1  ORF type:complete len:278 (+),score=17.51 TRINITY_DN3352_c0_g1_i3:83-916(+)
MMYFDEYEESERVPLLGSISINRPKRTPVSDLKCLNADIPIDCWSEVFSYLFEQQMTIETMQQALVLAHTNTFLRSVVVSMLKHDGEQIYKTVSSGNLICIAEYDSDELHRELAEMCLLYPMRLNAADALVNEVNAAGDTATRVFFQVVDYVHDLIFYTTVLAITDIYHSTWRVWTIGASSIFIIPLFVLGWEVCSATLKWWFSINPVDKCPHVSRHYLVHAINPVPWFRIAVLLISTVVISFLIATVAWRFGLYLDTLPQTGTDWILIFILLFVYS